MSAAAIARGGAQHNLAALVARFRTENPLDVEDFDAQRWQLPRRSAATAHVTRFVNFRSRRAENGTSTPFSKGFADLAKAFLCHREQQEPGKLREGSFFGIVTVFRYLVAAAAERKEPADLVRLDLHNAMRLMESEIKAAYGPAKLLEHIAAFLDAKGLVAAAPLRFESSLRPGDGSGGARRRRPSKEPTARKVSPAPSKNLDDEVAFALAEISNRDDLSDADLLLQRTVEIMLVSGKRPNEVLTAPHSFLIRRPTGPLPELDGEALCMRFWPLKNCPVRPTWVPTSAVPLIERAVADVERLTAATRSVARHQARTGEALLASPWIALDGDALIAVADVSRILWGELRTTIYEFLKQNAVEVLTIAHEAKCPTASGRPSRYVVRKRDLEALCLDKSFLGAVLPATNPSVRLHECLLLVPWGFPGKHPMLPTAQPLSDRHISAYLGGRKSIFARLGMRDRSGRCMRMTPRQARHWISTVLERGGLTPVQLAYWLGRRDASYHSVYSHVSLQERAARLRAKLEAGAGVGPLPASLRVLPVVTRAAAALSAVPTLRATGDVGDCSRDLSALPCLKNGECLGCSHHWTIKGDAFDIAGLRANIETLSWLLEDCLGDERPRQFAVYEKRLAISRAMLAFHEEAGIADGTPMNTGSDVL